VNVGPVMIFFTKLLARFILIGIEHCVLHPCPSSPCSPFPQVNTSRLTVLK